MAHFHPRQMRRQRATTVAPRRNSILISRAAVTAELSTWIGMNVPFSTGNRAAAALTVSIGFAGCARSSATTQRRNKFAFSLLAKATAAIDTPGLRQADTTLALNSALCWRRRRRVVLPSSEVFTCPPSI